jgi:hypothetical protein
MCEDLDGNMWVMYSSLPDIIRFKGLSKEYEIVSSDVSMPLSIIRDSFGAIWIGSTYGLYKYYPERELFKLLQFEPENNDFGCTNNGSKYNLQYY